MMSETTEVAAVEAPVDVETRIEERLYPAEDPVPAPAENPKVRAKLLEVPPDESEPVAKIDSNEISKIPDGDESEDEVEEQPKKVARKKSDPDEELYQALGVESKQVGYNDETGEIYFNAKVGDSDYQVPIKELVKSYQLEKHINSKSIALSEQQKEFDSTYGEFQSQYTAKLEQADNIANLMEKDLIGGFNQVDWDSLKAQDPTRYAVQRQEYADKARRIKDMQEKLNSEKGQHTERNNQVMQRQVEAFKADQAEKLLQNYPEWLNPDVMTKELTDARNFAADQYGFNEQELDGIYDHRIVRMLIDAQSFRNAKKNVESKAKKPVPKFQKPGSGRKPSAASKEAKAKRAALRASGNQADLASLLVDRF